MGYRLIPAIAISVALTAFAAGPLSAEASTASKLEGRGSWVAPCGAGTWSLSPPAYYAIDLVSTKRVAGARAARGVGQLTFAKSPFGISISSSGNYIYDLGISVDKLRPRSKSAYVAWASTPNLDRIQRLGVLDRNSQVAGRVTWNKFLVIITLEPSAADLGDTWRGPVVLRGMSRSGLMHTQAGHGPFEQEPCLKYGY